MKRDLDLIREIMLVLEDKMEYGKNFMSDKLFEIMKNETLSIEKLAYHIGLLAESNFIKVKEYKIDNEASFYVINTITSDGHDFIDTIREKHTWDIVKEKAVKIGGFTLSLLVDIGKEYLKKEICL